MGSADYRQDKKPVARLDFEQATWANGVSSAVAKTMEVNGIVEQIAVKINDNTGNRTGTVVITDANGATLFSKASIAENATTTYFARSYKSTQDADFNPCIAVGTLTATITPSGDPGASGMTVDVFLYLAK